MHPRQALNELLSSSDFHALEARLRRVSAFHVLGIDTRELSHAGLLAWFLDPTASHGMGAEPLRRFLLLGVHRATDAEVLDAVDLDRLDLSDALVQTERTIDIPGSDPDRRRRLDIIVELVMPGEENPTVIAVVEYKVDAAEGEEQTADYAAWCATQRSGIGGRSTLPIQIYLCPDPSDDKQPVPPFVNLGYSEYLTWAEAIDQIEKTGQAQFLLGEWRSCVLARNDVVDEQQELLTEKLRDAYADPIKALRSAHTDDLVPLQHAIEQHAEAFAELGIQPSRRGPRTKGYSGIIVLLRELLEAELDAERWAIAGGSGSVRAIFLPSIHAISDKYGGSPRHSGARLQIYADRPKNGRLGVVLEVIGDLPAKDRDESLAFRLETAEKMRTAIRLVDPDAPLRRRATCLRFPCDVPNISDIENDTDQNAAQYRKELAAIAKRLASIQHVFTDF